MQITITETKKMPCGDYYEPRKIGDQPCDGIYAGSPTKFKLQKFCKKCSHWSGYEQEA